MRVSGARTGIRVAPGRSTWSPGLSAFTVVGWYIDVRSPARSTRPSLRVIVPDEASTETTVPVASIAEVPTDDAGALGEDDVGGAGALAPAI